MDLKHLTFDQLNGLEADIVAEKNERKARTGHIEAARSRLRSRAPGRYISQLWALTILREGFTWAQDYYYQELRDLITEAGATEFTFYNHRAGSETTVPGYDLAGLS